MDKLSIDTGSVIEKQSDKVVKTCPARDGHGNKLYARFVPNEKVEELGMEEAMDFNKAVFGEGEEDFKFKDNFLYIKTTMVNKTIQAMIVEPYECRLDERLYSRKMEEKEALQVMRDILKSVYSLWMAEYWHRNLRPEHFVKVGPTWKMKSAVYSEDYSQANGQKCEFLWDPKHQAPEFEVGREFEEDEFTCMVVWNLGSILLDLLLGSHRLSTLEVARKFEGGPFSFKAVGISDSVSGKFSVEVRELLGRLLHYDPKKRMTMKELFYSKEICPEVAASMLAENGPAPLPPSKIFTGSTSKMSKVTTEQLSNAFDAIGECFKKQENDEKEAMKGVRSSLEDDLDGFGAGLKSISHIQKGSSKNLPKESKEEALEVEAAKTERLEDSFLPPIAEESTIVKKQESKKVEAVEPTPPPAEPPQRQQPAQAEPQHIDGLMGGNKRIGKALELYKSYFDQSELLMCGIGVIERLGFPKMSAGEAQEVRKLCRFAISLVSLINLNKLAEGFNQGRNVLDLEGDLFTLFQDSPEYEAFQKYVNFVREERGRALKETRQALQDHPDKRLLKDKALEDMTKREYKGTSFSSIKAPYRQVVKFAYDAIAEQYNQEKKTEKGGELARTAMYVTYCLTTDKLYIKTDIPENFKLYFEWLQAPPSDYVPLHSFKRYIDSAPRERLIEHSRYVLKKYYNI